jgi:hypothetical protein
MKGSALERFLTLCLLVFLCVFVAATVFFLGLEALRWVWEL